MPRYYVRTSFGFWRTVMWFSLLTVGAVLLDKRTGAVLAFLFVAGIVTAVFWLLAKLTRYDR